jgi:uncharacterized protein YoaH (UPF0181 family)
MAKNRTFFLGRPPFGMLAAHLAQDEDFILDAQLILALPQGVLERLSAELAASPAFLDKAAVEEVTKAVVPEGTQPVKIAETICRLARLLHSSGMPAQNALDLLAEAIRKNAKELTEEQRQDLVQRIRKLAAEPIGLAKQNKAKELTEATGAVLDQFRLICDIRPIFDAPRVTIEGAMPLTILRLEYTEPDGSSDVVEFRVNPRQLARLEAEAAAALGKLKAITAKLEACGIAIPSMDTTTADED